MTTTRQDSDYTYSPPVYSIEVVDTGDDELNAMAAIKAAMEMFLPDNIIARERVVRWAAERYKTITLEAE